jgi:Zn-dependent oligopeptidase
MIEIEFNKINKKILNENYNSIVKNTTDVYNHVSKYKKKNTFKNTILPIIKNDINMANLQYFSMVSSFFPNEELRKLATNLESKLSNFFVECEYRKDVFKQIKKYYNGHYKEEKKKLSLEENRFIKNTMINYKRIGIDKKDSTIEKINKELNDMSIQFSNNLNEEKSFFKIRKQDLKGMPKSWFTKDKMIKKDIYKVTLKYPDYYPLMKYCEIEDTRKKLYIAFNNRCKDVNLKLFNKTIKLRSDLASKLGYKNHADYRTELKIVKNSKTAIDFLDNLNKKLQKKYNNEKKDLLTFAKKNKFKKDKLDQWDINFYVRMYKEKNYKIDMQEVRKFFPLKVVTNGLLEIYQKILGLKFKLIETKNKWHKDVLFYEVSDKKNKKIIGHFYLDLHPREGKYGHAAVFPIYAGCSTKSITKKKTRRLPLVAMACNFPKNECLEFGDVVTFFHEFGHVMHQICSKTELLYFTGFNVENDFVEAPSQMLEYWCYTDKALKKMTSHIDTGKKIPKKFINKIKELKNVYCGHSYKRQLLFGIYDMMIHTKKNIDPLETWYTTKKYVLGDDIEDDTVFISSFGHLMGGYDAGYYGYLRSETYASNMFNKMFKDNVLNVKIGMRYRKKILEPGSTKDGIELLRDFLEENPSDNYFFEEIDI